MILFYIETCWSTFLQQQLGVFLWAVVQLTSGAGPEKQITAASNLPAEPVAASRGLKHMLYKTGRGEAGEHPLLTLIQTSLENLTRDKSTNLFDLASGPVVFSQIKSFGHNDDTTQQGAYLSLTQ